MAQAFNLTAQLQLQSPKNVNQVVNDLRRQLKPIGIQVKLDNTRNLATANRDLQNFSKNARQSNKNMSELNRTLQESARRFSVITIATGSFLALANSFKKSVKEAVAFERELVRISQVTGKTVRELSSLSEEVTRLGTSLGASSSDLLSVARTLAQAGFAAEETTAALDILAKTSLGATFDSIQDTTEGAIALLRQFGDEARASGGDIKFLEQSLDAINAVSKSFAVESGDLISVIRRTGGVFAAAGGSVNELIALFTSVRATTRESAETIATGLRTIFTRIQRVETIEQLKALNIQLQDSEGRFVGAFEAIRRLSEGLSALDPRDFRFSQVVEELGGFRQIGKVIPLIQQFTTAQQALAVAQGASGSVAADAETAQQSLGVQIQKVREQFDALIRKFADSSTFRSLANGGLELAKAFIKIADSLEPLLPLLVSLVGLKLGQGIAPAIAGLAGIGRSAGTRGPVTKFASGGMVPGSGNRDTVPAMLTPGEFVIRKSSVQKLGAGTLAAMNQGREKYAKGGTVRIKGDSAANPIIGQIAPRGAPGVSTNGSYETTLSNLGIRPRKGETQNTQVVVKANVDKNVLAPKDVGFEEVVSRSLDKVQPVIDSAASETFGLKTKSKIVNDTNAVNSISGFLFESFASAVVGKAAGDKNPFDFVGEKRSKQISKFADADPIARLLDAKNQFVNPGQIIKKAVDYKKGVGKSDNRIRFNRSKKFFGGPIQKFAAGGIIQAKQAGAAVLEPEGKDTLTVPVSVKDVKSEFGKAATGIKFARGKDPFTKRYSDTSFKVNRQGLDRETSTKFRQNINDGVVAGLDFAGSNLGADLGLGPVKIDQSTKQNFINSLRAAQIGDAFENILSTLSNRGRFDSSVDPNRPFDFPAGLQGPIKDNFDTLPESFVDAKSSFEAASKENFKGKILRQLKQELINSGIYEDTPIFKAPRKKALGGTIHKFAEGGAASDTVPALLTPGEFVFNKEAAQSIGYGNLNRMNKQGVQGFAKGGAVGIQTFEDGGLTLGFSDRQAFNAISGGPNVPPLDDPFKNIDAASKTQQKRMEEENKKRKEVGDALNNNKIQIDKTGKIIDKTNQKRSKLGSILDTLSANARKASRQFGDSGARRTNTTVKRAFGTSEGRQALGQGLNQAASAAQSFVFLGASVAAVTSQMSGLEETTKTAINETAGFATGLVGIGGTLLQVFTSMTAAGASEIVSEEINTQATNKNTEAQLRNSAAGSKAASAIGVFAVGFVAGISALKFFSSKATAEADKLSKGLNDALGKIKDGAEANANDLKASARKEIEARNEAAKFTISPTSGQGVANLAGAAAGAGLGAKAGAAIGTIIAPGIGTAIGGLIGAIAGGIGGALLPSVFASNELTEAQKRQTEQINNSIDSLISLNAGISSLKQASEDLAKAESAGVSGEELVSRGLQAARSSGGAGAATGFQEASNTLAELAQQAGKTVAELEKSDFEGDPGALIRFNLATQQAASAQELAAAQAKITGETLQRAFKETDASKTFDELVTAGGPFAQALRQNIAAIKAESGIRQIALKQQIDENKRRISESTGEDRVALIKQGEVLQKAYNDEQARSAQLQKDVVNGLRASQQARNAEVIALERARQQQVALTAALAKTEAFLSNISNIELNLDRQSESLDNFAAVIDNATLKIKASGVDEIGNVSNVSNLDKFSNQINQITGKFGPEAQKIGDELTQSASVLKNARSLIGTSFKLSDPVKTGEVLNRLGLTPQLLGPGGEKLFQEIAESLQKASTEGVLTEDIVKDIFAPVEKLSGKQTEVIQKLIGINQKEIDNLQKFLDVKEKLRQREVEQKQKEIETIKEGADLRAKATELIAKSRGVEIDPSESARSQRVRNEQTRAARNQAALRGIRVGGRQISARNVGQVAGVRRAAIQERRRVQQEIAAGNSSRDLIIRQQQLKVVIDSTTGVLEDFTKQGDAANDIFAEMEANISVIERERAARQQVLGVLEEFVVGGQDARQNLLQASAGVRQAFATGTLQLQSPEQRQATVGLLDKLADVELFPGFTGKEIKQELVIRDAIRMGLDPRIAEQLATATSTEEKLINANVELAKKIDLLTQATNASVRALNQGDDAAGLSTGGLVQYRANGGSIFQPRGTDTVPAMLTPGEFVIRKSAVDKVGVGALQQINNGGSLVPGFAMGGVVLDDKNKNMDKQMSNKSAENIFQDDKKQKVVGLAKGGKVKYLNNGGRVRPEPPFVKPSGSRGGIYVVEDQGLLDTDVTVWNRKGATDEYDNYFVTVNNGINGGKIAIPKGDWYRPKGKVYEGVDQGKYRGDEDNINRSFRFSESSQSRPKQAGEARVRQRTEAETQTELDNNKQKTNATTYNRGSKLVADIGYPEEGGSYKILKFNNDKHKETYEIYKKALQDGILEPAEVTEIVGKYNQEAGMPAPLPAFASTTPSTPDPATPSNTSIQAGSTFSSRGSGIQSSVSAPSTASSSTLVPEQTSKRSTAPPYEKWISNQVTIEGIYQGVTEDRKNVKIQARNGAYFSIPINDLNEESKALGSKYWTQEQANKRARNLYRDMRQTGPIAVAALQNASLQGFDSVSPEKLETWTDNTGDYTTRAKYRGVSNPNSDKTVLNLEKEDGSGVGVPQNRLSKESQDLATKYYRALGYAKGGKVNYLFGGGFGRGYGPQSGLGAAYGQMMRGQGFMQGRMAMGQRFMANQFMMGQQFMANRFMMGQRFLASMVPQVSVRPGMRTNVAGGASAMPYGGKFSDFLRKLKVEKIPNGQIQSIGDLRDPNPPALKEKELQQLFKTMRSTGGTIPFGSVLNRIFPPTSAKRFGTRPNPANPQNLETNQFTDKYSLDINRRIRQQEQEEQERDRDKEIIESVAGFLSEGYTNRQISERFPFVTRDHFRAAVALNNREGDQLLQNLGLAKGGKVPYFSNGGATGGDSVPAMLTPGEFVMNADTVKKYGVGFMQNLNKGNLPGYNKGGLVQYRQTGGGIMDMQGGAAQSLNIDTSKIESVFNSFVGDFSSVFDNILKPFSGIVDTLNNLSQTFGNFVMSHNVAGDLNVNIQGINSEVIKNEVSKYVVDLIGEQVKIAFKNQNNNYKA